jgi:hypothetical protein
MGADFRATGARKRYLNAFQSQNDVAPENKERK